MKNDQIDAFVGELEMQLAAANMGKAKAFNSLSQLMM